MSEPCQGHRTAPRVLKILSLKIGHFQTEMVNSTFVRSVTASVPFLARPECEGFQASLGERCPELGCCEEVAAVRLPVTCKRVSSPGSET
jgi:hypothetical protein